ncbi:MAG TPA: YeeE/YedE thiosulfate transporter family protein [Flavilitoribacter sp.]|nr:YeeE/YedE thiosulfate transporter family protein [Flavilitoribacter sp.]HMQ88081.1 YeeE/YedE thiosulfate transporter family protein [Flavilitoribacter sp.]
MEFLRDVISIVSQPWHWAVSGAVIAGIMFLLLWFGERFGVSRSFETLCSIAGAGRKVSYFNFDWRRYNWLLTFIGGSVAGGFIAVYLLPADEPVRIAQATVEALQKIGVKTPETKAEGLGFLPGELFNFASLATLKGLILMVGGGFLIGFGSRWAGGCTSGHGISGLANLQLPSMVAVIGFFIGGLLMTHLLLPLILKL